MKNKQFHVLSSLLMTAVFLLIPVCAQAGIGIEYSSNQGWNAGSTGTTSLYSSVSVNAGDVVVMSVADNKKNSIALVRGGWSGGANGVLTDLETSGDTYPASYISYIEIEQVGTYDFWMECGDPNLTAISALYVLRPDSGETAFLADSAEWIDPDNADNGTAYSLDYTFATTLIDGVLIEAISARTDLITEPVTYTEDRNGSDKRLLVSYDGVTGGGWASAYTLTGGEAGKQTSSGIGVVFSAGVGGGNNGNGGTTPADTIHEWTFDTEADGTSFSGLVDSGSIGGATFASDATGTYVANDTLRVGASGDGTSAFRNAIVTARTEGKYELTWTVVSAQVTTDGINVGLGFRQSSDNTDILLVRTHYDDATGFIIQTRMNNANTTLVTLGGTTISSLSYRAVVNLDSDTFDLFYDLGSGEQTAVTGMALAAPDLTLDMIRFAASSKDYGPSDEFFLDDIAITIPGEPVSDPVFSNPSNSVTDVTGDGLALIGETNTVSVVLKNSGGGTITNATATLTAVSNPEYFTIAANSGASSLNAGDEATSLFEVIARTNAAVGVYDFNVIGSSDNGLAITNQIQIEVISGVSVSGQDADNTFSLVANTTNQIITNLQMVVNNASFAKLVCTFSDSAAWLRDIGAVTVPPRSVTNIALIADSTGLNLGSYSTPLLVNYSQSVSDSYSTFTVRFDVGAKLTFSGSSVINEINNGYIPNIYEPNDIVDLVLTNFNEGGVTVSNAVNSLTPPPGGYFSIVPITPQSYGSLPPGAIASTVYRVTIAEDTPEGSYIFAVTNTADYDGSSFTWPGSLTLDVVNRAEPAVVPGSVNLLVVAGQTDTAQLIVTNSGNAAVTFTIADDAAWSTSYTAVPGTAAMLPNIGNTMITLNDPDPGNQFITAETEGVSAVMPIGFSFPFYGTQHSNFYVTADGAIGLGDTANNLGNGDGSLPDGGDVPLIAPFWGSLSAPAGSISFRLYADYLAVTYTGVDQVSSFGGTGLSFQTLLYRNGRVEFRYGNISGNWLDTVTVGIQQSATVFTNLSLTPASGTSVMLMPNQDIRVTYEPGTSTVNPFSSVPVVFKADASALQSGDTIGFNVVFNWSNGGSSAVPVQVTVVSSLPVYEANSSLNFSGPAGEITSVPFIITNSGDALLSYSFSDNAAAAAGIVQTNADYGWIDISSIGTDVILLDPDPNPFITAADEGTGGLIPIGFDFPFFGGSYTEMAVSANGAIRLDGGTGRVRVMDSLASTDAAMPEQMIAPYWGDLVLDSNATLKYHTDGSRLVVSWENVQQYGISAGADLSFQMMLESDGSIHFNYKLLEGYPWPHTLIGLRDTAARTVLANIRQPGDATTNTYIYSGQTYVVYADTITERAAAFLPGEIQVISVSPASGTVSPGGTVELTVRGDASNLSGGSNSAVTNATFTIAHNAAGSPASLAVTFTATNRQQTAFASPAATAADSDGDGMDDDAERIAGTDPQNSESFFVVQIDDGRQLTWTPAEGRTYTVWYTTSLSEPFNVLAEGISGGAYVDAELAGEPVIFYRVTVE